MTTADFMLILQKKTFAKTLIVEYKTNDVNRF